MHLETKFAQWYNCDMITAQTWENYDDIKKNKKKIEDTTATKKTCQPTANLSSEQNVAIQLPQHAKYWYRCRKRSQTR